MLGYAECFGARNSSRSTSRIQRFSPSGLYVWIAAAKNDPRKQGRELYVPQLPATGPNADLCAVMALERWLERFRARGPVFRTFDLRGRLTENRLDPRGRRAHPASAAARPATSPALLRRGFITNAAKKIPIENIKRVTGQRSSGIALNYVAAATLHEDPPLGDRRPGAEADLNAHCVRTAR